MDGIKYKGSIAEKIVNNSTLEQLMVRIKIANNCKNNNDFFKDHYYHIQKRIEWLSKNSN